jgi:uncharacterized membrane protein YecN with MAPEG domain
MSTIAIISIAVMGIMLFLLGANVTRERALRGDTGNQMPSGDPTDRLLIAQRAHGNAAEYVPTLIVLIIVCSTLTDGWWLDTLCIVATASRLVHAMSMLAGKSLAVHWPYRDVAATFTYLAGVLLGVTAIVSL